MPRGFLVISLPNQDETPVLTCLLIPSRISAPLFVPYGFLRTFLPFVFLLFLRRPRLITCPFFSTTFPILGRIHFPLGSSPPRCPPQNSAPRPVCPFSLIVHFIDHLPPMLVGAPLRSRAFTSARFCTPSSLAIAYHTRSFVAELIVSVPAVFPRRHFLPPPPPVCKCATHHART